MLEALRKQVESLSAAYTASKQQNQQSRSFTAADLTEAETRQKIIDIDLKAMGWKFTGPDADVRTEYEVDNMNGVLGQKGYADYVLMGKDGLPLAVIEAKRSTKDPNIGRKQAQLYADCLEQKFGRRPMLFTTNGYTTYFWDEQSGPQRAVSGVFCKEDLQKLMNRRTEKKRWTPSKLTTKSPTAITRKTPFGLSAPTSRRASGAICWSWLLARARPAPHPA